MQILRYLAASYGSDSFWPSDPVNRATVDQWAEWAKINVAGKFTDPIFWELVRVPESRRRPDVIDAGLVVLNRALKIADDQLARNQYLAGEDFTVADIQLGHCLYRYFSIDIPRIPYDHIERYYAMLCRREAYQSHVHIDYSELADSM